MDVRKDFREIWPKIKWQESQLILFVFEVIAYFSIRFTVARQVLRFWPNANPKFVTDLWLLIVLFVQIIYLVYFSPLYNFLFFSLIVYFLLDTIFASLRDVLLSPLLHDGSIQVYSRQRWIILTLISAIEVVLNFAILILWYREDFQSPTNVTIDALTSVYISSVTFMTLGYGDFYPVGESAKIIVLFELGFFLLFFTLKLPIAANMVKVKEPNG